MSTQGMISVVSPQGETEFKIIAGCNGVEAFRFALELTGILRRSFQGSVALELMEEAVKHSFGCASCTLVVSRTEILSPEQGGIDVEGVTSYQEFRATFSDPLHCSRWVTDEAAYTYLIDSKTLEVFSAKEWKERQADNQPKPQDNWISVEDALPEGIEYAKYPGEFKWPQVILDCPEWPEKRVGYYIATVGEWRFLASPSNMTKYVKRWQHFPAPRKT